MELAIIEDDPDDQLQLKGYIQDYLQLQNIDGNIRSYQSGEDFLSDFTAGTFYIVFLDIYMHGINGIEVARRIREHDTNCLLIFISFSDTHAVESYRVRAFDYLLKPYQKELLFETMDLCINALEKDSHFIEIKEKRTMVHILHKDIIYADTSDHYVNIYTQYGVTRSRMLFTNLWGLLAKDRRFLVCYRNVLVNMDMIEKMNKNSFLLTNGACIPIQNNRLPLVRQTFADYLFQKAKRRF